MQAPCREQLCLLTTCVLWSRWVRRRAQQACERELDGLENQLAARRVRAAHAQARASAAKQQLEQLQQDTDALQAAVWVSDSGA